MHSVLWTDSRGQLVHTFVLRPHRTTKRPMLLRIAVQSTFGRAAFSARVVLSR
jgi:hypothetical protein